MSVPPEYLQLLLGMQQDPNLGTGLPTPPAAAPQPIPAAPVPAPAAPAPAPVAANNAPLVDIQDPLTRMAMFSAAMQMFQPVAPGQSKLGHTAQALQGGLQTLHGLREGQRKAGLEERKVKATETGLEQQQSQFSEQMKLKWDEFPVDKKYKTALANYYDRMPVGRGEGQPDPKDILDNSTKLAEAQWNGLINAGMSPEELIKLMPGGPAAAAQNAATHLMQILQMKDPKQMQAYLDSQQEYREKFGIDPITRLPIPGFKKPGDEGTPEAGAKTSYRTPSPKSVEEALAQKGKRQTVEAEQQRMVTANKEVNDTYNEFLDYDPQKSAMVQKTPSKKEAAALLQKLDAFMKANTETLSESQYRGLGRVAERLDEIANGK